MNEINLKTLVGKHILSGVDTETESIKVYDHSDYEDSQVIRFCLDDVVYTAVEDPSDGYRSSLVYCIKDHKEIKNKIKGVEVFGVYMSRSAYGDSSDIIQFYDTTTNEVVLTVGTDHSDDYYPSFIGYWNPVNLSINVPNNNPTKRPSIKKAEELYHYFFENLDDNVFHNISLRDISKLFATKVVEEILNSTNEDDLYNQNFWLEVKGEIGKL